MPSYLISGLHVASELELPGAIREASQAAVPDASIRRGPVPMAVAGATASGPTWEMAGKMFLLRVPRLARLWITAGRDIAVEIEPGATDRDVAGLVLGTAFGILLHQRGALVLRAAAVAKDGCAMAIWGAAGVGKSTLAAALCGNGCSFVADDLCVVGSDAHRLPVVLPDGRQLKLWKRSIDWLDLMERRGEAVRESFAKYFIDPHCSAVEPTRLSAIYVLREALAARKAAIERLPIPEAIRLLHHEAYRPGIRAKMPQEGETLSQAAAMFGHARAFVLSRPRGFEHIPEIVTELRAHWDSLDR